MKLISYFDDFLKSEVNLDQTRLDTANSRIETITGFIENENLFSRIFKKSTPQGSFKHQTIIKPVNVDDEFDVDLLIELNEIVGWEPKHYINNLYSIFNDSDRYNDIVEKNTRCITLNYKSDFHMDLVPCIKKIDNYYIFNEEENSTEITDWYWYADWFKEKNDLTNWNLKKVVRLLKYLRDYHNSFDIKSILLTTLIAREVNENEDYQDVPSTLKILINSLSGKLYNIIYLDDLDLSNPVLPDEQFDRHINQDIYENFRNEILKLNILIDEAYNETDKNVSIELWKNIFWESFWKSNSKNSIVKIIANEWMWEKPVWEKKLIGRVVVNCNYYTRISKYNTQKITVKNLHTFVIWQKVKFSASVYNISWPYEVKWQVVNTWDEVRWDKEKMRWDFFNWRDENLNDVKNSLTNWEKIWYKWIHWIKCYIIKNNFIVWESERFYVIVD